jgi:hypothetical protein
MTQTTHRLPGSPEALTETHAYFYVFRGKAEGWII